MYQLKFDEARIFRPECLPALRDYFDGRVTAQQARDRLGWTLEFWDHHLAGIFSIAFTASTAAGLAAVRQRTEPAPAAAEEVPGEDVRFEPAEDLG